MYVELGIKSTNCRLSQNRPADRLIVGAVLGSAKDGSRSVGGQKFPHQSVCRFIKKGAVGRADQPLHTPRWSSIKK